MGIFSRSGVDVIDLPDLHRRKLIKLPEREDHKELKQGEMTKDGFFDLSNSRAGSDLQVSEQTPSTSEQVTDFLSDFASIGASNPNVTPIKQVSNQANNGTESVKDLKWRIENLEFKLEQLTEKLNTMTSQSS